MLLLRFLRGLSSVAIVSAMAFVFFVSGCQSQPQRDETFSTREAVGKIGPQRYYTPANQILTPAGTQVELPGMRPQALALSPDGRLLVTSGETHELVVLDSSSGKILQHVPLPPDNSGRPEPGPVSSEILHPDTKAQEGFIEGCKVPR